nr:hypothetical protein [Tanacetum cinerariifolium]
LKKKVEQPRSRKYGEMSFGIVELLTVRFGIVELLIVRFGREVSSGVKLGLWLDDSSVSHYPGGRNVYIWKEKRDKVCTLVHISMMIASHTMSFWELQKWDKVCTSRLECFLWNIVTNSRVTPSWREIVCLTFSEAGILHRHCNSLKRVAKKMKQLNKEIKPGNYTKINHLLGVFVLQMAKSREELYFSNTSKTANVSNPISIPNEEFPDDTTPSVARKFLNEIKSIVTLQRAVKHRMTLETQNWSSSAHQELHKIVKDETFSIVNQVDARVQNFEIHFLKEATKFVGDFKSLAKEADESLAKHRALELEIERLLRAVVSQDIISIVQNNSVGETSDLQTELERTKERFENCIIKKENEYAKLWNDWYKKCEECKFDKISYDKAYNDMQQTIEWLQAQLGDLKGKSKDTSCVSDTLNPLSQKLENKNVINPFKPSREEKHVPTKVRASVRINPITVSQPPVITKKVVNSDSNGLSSTGVDNTKTRWP